jgi:isopentenyl-diphosphate delta-isomerase
VPSGERVVLLDEHGEAIGTEDKRAVHHAATPLHLAFSCYVFNQAGELLVTQRAKDKATFPGVWSNTACGHPAPGEEFMSAVTRRTGQELGIALAGLRLVLPRFRYRAVMAGVVENEMCPVATAVTDDDPRPDPVEVADWEWVPWSSFRDSVLVGRRSVSPWCVEQIRELTAAGFGDDPLGWPAADGADLPPAARPT